MSWRRWKLGLGVAFTIGFFTACAAAGILDVRLNFKFACFFIGLVGKDVILFLVNHPTDSVSFDTETTTKEEPK